MTGAGYRPYPPQGVPVAVDRGIWTIEGPILSYAFGPVKIPCPTRATVMADPQGGLWIHSPIAHASALQAAIEALGPVRGLIAPNSFHHLHLAEWARAVPDAAIMLAPGLEARFAALAARLVPVAEAWAQGKAAGGGWLTAQCLDGGGWRELVFHHAPSRSLVATDIVQNFEPARITRRGARLLLRLAGAGRGPMVSGEMLAMAWRRRRLSAVRQALAAIRAVPARRLLIAHGAQPSAAALARRGWAIDPSLPGEG